MSEIMRESISSMLTTPYLVRDFSLHFHPIRVPSDHVHISHHPRHCSRRLDRRNALLDPWHRGAKIYPHWKTWLIWDQGVYELYCRRSRGRVRYENRIEEWISPACWVYLRWQYIENSGQDDGSCDGYDSTGIRDDSYDCAGHGYGIEFWETYHRIHDAE